MLTYIVIGFIVLVGLYLLLQAITFVNSDANKRPAEPVSDYISDEDYLNNGGVIRYHHYGKSRE